MSADVQQSYAKLLDRYRDVSRLENATSALIWDQKVMMPEGGIPARSKQVSLLSGLGHERFVAEKTGRLLNRIDEDELNALQRANVREIKRQYNRHANVPDSLIDELADAESNAHDTWQRAREANDFDEFKPIFKTVTDLNIKRAQEIDSDAHPLAVMVADTEPDISFDRIEDILTDLKRELVPLIERIQEDGREIETNVFHGSFDSEAQLEAFRETLTLVGYDWSRGRLDTTAHPFGGGTPFDARIATRTDESDMINGFTSTMHEFGHALYSLGLPKDTYTEPVGQARSKAVHESQSRFWENHVGLSRAFWEVLLPRLTDQFPQLSSVTPKEAYQSATQVKTDEVLRTGADELTYHLHLLVRIEIERAYIDGEIDIDDIPQVWDERMDAYLGVTPPDDAHGCMQDAQWTHGFGNFHKFVVGSVLAAQLAATLEDDLGPLDELIGDERFDDISHWLRNNVHQHGQRYRSDELIERATGEPLTAKYFVRYVTEKYETLYDL